MYFFTGFLQLLYILYQKDRLTEFELIKKRYTVYLIFLKQHVTHFHYETTKENWTLEAKKATLAEEKAICHLGHCAATWGRFWQPELKWQVRPRRHVSRSSNICLPACVCVFIWRKLWLCLSHSASSHQSRLCIKFSAPFAPCPTDAATAAAVIWPTKLCQLARWIISSEHAAILMRYTERASKRALLIITSCWDASSAQCVCFGAPKSFNSHKTIQKHGLLIKFGFWFGKLLKIIRIILIYHQL